MLFRRRPNPPSGPQEVVFERREVSYQQLARRRWPRDIDRLRKELPGGLYDSGPPGNARFGSWFVVANADRQAIGYAWAVHLPGFDGEAYIEEAAVLAPYRRQQVGRYLATELARWVGGLGYSRVAVKPVSPTGWLSPLGFRPINEIGTWRAEIPDILAAGPTPGTTLVVEARP